MAISENQTREDLAVEYGATGSWIGVFTSAAEASGGSPAYARKQTSWTSGAADGVITGSQVEIDLPAGTYTHIGIFADASGATLRDKKAISSKTLEDQGKLLVTPTFTVS